MTFPEIADSILKLLTSGAIVAVGVLILKAFREQLGAANAMKAVKDETISQLEKAHSTQVDALRDQIEVLKQQRDFGSTTARKIRQEDMAVLEEKIKKLQEERDRLQKELDETRKRNEEQIRKNEQIMQEMVLVDSDVPFDYKKYIENLHSANAVLSSSNTVLKSLTPWIGIAPATKSSLLRALGKPFFDEENMRVVVSKDLADGDVEGIVGPGPPGVGPP